jgi:hypothetical protein
MLGVEMAVEVTGGDRGLQMHEYRAIEAARFQEPQHGSISPQVTARREDGAAKPHLFNTPHALLRRLAVHLRTVRYLNLIRPPSLALPR